MHIVQSLKPTQSIRMCNEVKNPTDQSTTTDNHLVKILYIPLQNSVAESTDNI